MDSIIGHDKFVLINNVLDECDTMKEAIKNLKTESVYRRFWSIYKTMLSHLLKCRRNTESKNPKLA